MFHWLYILFALMVFAYTGKTIISIDRGFVIMVIGFIEFVPEILFIAIWAENKRQED